MPSPAMLAHTRWDLGDEDECGGGFMMCSQRDKAGHRKGLGWGGALCQLCH